MQLGFTSLYGCSSCRGGSLRSPGSVGSRACWFSVLLFALFAVALNAHSQSSDPVHLIPRNQTPRSADDILHPPPNATVANPHAASLRIDANLVIVPTTVTDAMNRPVMGLGRQDFALYENDQQQEIEYFSVEDAPLSVGMILDLSGSMNHKFDTERVAVSEFFKNANAGDDYFVVTFSDRPAVLTAATQSIGTIESKLAEAKPHGSTALLDAISVGMTQMHWAQYRRRALLIISDGGDNNSRHWLGQIKRMVQDSDVAVYAIGIFNTGVFKTFEEFMGRKWLSEITDATGGRTIAVSNLDGVPDAATAISRELRDQYVLGYRPSGAAQDGKRRKIKVRVLQPAGNAVPMMAHYRFGYTPQTR